jgi:hypothetical protein
MPLSSDPFVIRSLVKPSFNLRSYVPEDTIRQPMLGNVLLETPFSPAGPSPDSAYHDPLG